MKTTSVFAFTLVMSAVVGGIGYWAGQYKSRPAATTMTEMPQKERKVLYWYDPMVPNQHFDKGGKSPFMDMALVPMYDDDSATPGTVKIDPATIQNMGIRTAKVTMGSLSRHIDTTGYINPDEHHIQVVQTRAAGWVERLHVSAVNDPVKRGQVLLELYSPELVAAQEEYLLARQNRTMSGGDALLQAAQSKLALFGLTKTQIEGLKTGNKPSRLITYYAPSNGIVTELNVRQGAQVSPGMNLYSLVDLSSVWVTAEIPETQGSWLREGLTASVSVPTYPAKQFKGRVEYVYPKVAETTRTLQVRIRLANPDGMLKPGMFANVSLDDGAKQDVLLVPTEAVITTGRRSVVIVADGNGKFHPAEVHTGRESAGQYEIVDGLTEGQTIVISAQFLIDSESNLKTALDRLQPPDEAAMQQDKSATTPAMPKTYSGHGRINEINPNKTTLNITHDPIPSLKWPGMTMDFSVKDPAVLKSLKPSDEINFELTESEKGDYTIVNITKGAK